MRSTLTDPINREVLLAFWKIHILHHAAEQPIYGQWIIEELRRHGYSLSPGTLYPLLTRMEKHGWLKSRRDRKASIKARREYVLTPKGARVLARVRRQVKELFDEVVQGVEEPRSHHDRRRARETAEGRR
jgi:PadR family transcriptional regulator PadR